MPKINPADLVGVGEIAEQAKVSGPAVCNWINRHEDFPEPFVALACGNVYLWSQVKAWLKETGRLKESV